MPIEQVTRSPLEEEPANLEENFVMVNPPMPEEEQVEAKILEEEIQIIDDYFKAPLPKKDEGLAEMYYEIDLNRDDAELFEKSSPAEATFLQKVTSPLTSYVYDTGSNVASKLTEYAKAKATNYALSRVVEDDVLKRKLQETYVASYQGGRDLQTKINELVESIPEDKLDKIADGFGQILPALASSYTNKLFTRLPGIGSLVGAANNPLTAAIKNGLFPEAELTRIVAQKSAKNVTYNSVLNNYFKIEAKKGLKPILKSLIKILLDTNKSSSTKYGKKPSILNDPNNLFIDTGDSFRKIRKEELQEEYLRAWTQVQLANIAGEDLRRLLVCLKHNLLEPIGNAAGVAAYDANNPAKGYAYDIAVGILPRLTVDTLANQVLTNNYTEVDARVRLINAEKIAQQLELKLDDPSIEDIRQTVAKISDESTMFGMYNFRNKIAEKASKATQSLLSGLAKTARQTAYNGFKKSWSFRFKTSKSDLEKAQKIYSIRLKALKDIKNGLDDEKLTHEKFESLVNRYKSLVTSTVSRKLERINLKDEATTRELISKNEERLSDARREILIAFNGRRLDMQPEREIMFEAPKRRP